MKIGFDLDGTLDRKPLADLAKHLLQSGHKVYVISGSFIEAGDWQNADAKARKLERLGFRFTRAGAEPMMGYAELHVLDAMPDTYPTEYRVRDLGLRKGNLVERLGIELMFDDSETYCTTMPAMCGATILQVR